MARSHPATTGISPSQGMPVPVTPPGPPLTWLITGVASGLGLALARLVLAGGHNLIATSRNPSQTPDLVAEIESKGGQWLALDVNSPHSPNFINNLEWGGVEIDVLVSIAGFCVFGPVETASEDEIRGQMETMYFGPLRLIRTVVPYMRERRFGVIVNIGSGASLEGAEAMGCYAGAKAALDGVTRVLAKEVAPFNIRTLTVVAGTFNTNFGANARLGANPLPEDYKDSMAELMMNTIKSGKAPAKSDKEKGMRAVYEVVVGEGVGAGHEDERLLLLGADMEARAMEMREYLRHALEVFGEVTNGVGLGWSPRGGSLG